MPIAPGGQLGPYQILSLLGEGGMGQVWKAHDTRLQRTVAIKTSHQQFNERFEREALAVAALNHPNVCTLHDIGPDFLVMEFVDGPTLSARLANGALPLAEALPIARQIAEAVEAAHEKGIIHRDLKPENVKITADGAVKVLDFGLAKAAEVSQDPASAPTIRHSISAVGTIMGTPGYMAPEQAAGKQVDRRADIWAFGVVLWEMLCGARLFHGETVMHTLADVVNRPIDLDRLPPETPLPIRELLRRCLDRDLKTRLRDIGEARIAIQRYLADPSPTPAAPAPVPAATGWPKRTFAAFAAIITLLAAGVVYWQRPSPSPEASARFFIMPPPGAQFLPFNFALSPDGRYLAASVRDKEQTQIWLRHLDSTTLRPIPGTEEASAIFWSPDSRSIGFSVAGKLKRVEVGGGAPRVICDTYRITLPTATWGAEGVILFVNQGKLMRVSAAGGTPVPVSLPGSSSDATNRYPKFLPDGRHFIYGSLKTPEPDGVYLATVDNTEPPRMLLKESGEPVFAPTAGDRTGHLFFRRENGMMAVRLDWGKGKVDGDPFPVLENIPYSNNSRTPVTTSNPARWIAWNETGSNGVNPYQLVTLDRSGRQLRLLTQPDTGRWEHVSLSPDGSRLAANVLRPQGSDIWTFDLVRNVASRLTTGQGVSGPPVFSADGKSVIMFGAFGGQHGLYTIAADGSSRPELFLAADAHHMHASPVGKYLAYEPRLIGTEKGLVVLRLEKGSKPDPLVDKQQRPGHPQFSPDSRWLAYSSLESGEAQIYVQSFPAGAGRWQVSSKGGALARWRRDGKELVFVDRSGGVWSASVTPRGRALEFGVPVKLFSANFAQNSYFTMSPDAQRFYGTLEASPGSDSAPHPLTLILNWAATIERSR